MRIIAGLCFSLFLMACSSTPAPPPHSTPTPGTGQMCGGFAAIRCNNPGDYCAMETGICIQNADASGICQPRPEICTMEYMPVCGCDGKTYSNACSARASGASIAHPGQC